MAETVDAKNWGRSTLEKHARGLWKKMVTELGTKDAKEIMRSVMGAKSPGPRFADEEFAITMFVLMYIQRWGQKSIEGSLTDKKIARFIFETNPRFVQLESGYIFVANDHITEDDLTIKDDLTEEGSPRDPIVEIRPVEKSLAAWEKQVERLRRKAIEKWGLSKEEYAPRPYHRD